VNAPEPLEDDLRIAELLTQYEEFLRAGRHDACRRMMQEHPQLLEFADCLTALDALARLSDPHDPPAPADPDMTLLDTRVRTAAIPLGTFGDFELLREIGRGGMGVVYLARQKSLDRVVALKMILSGQWSSDAMISRFHGEARMAASLRHPHIIRVHEAGELHGQHFLVMEYVDGRSLDRLVDAGPLSPSDAARYVATIAEAVHYLHQSGIVHRDLKPSNVLVDSDDRVYVTDFGLAKLMDNDSQLTRTGELLGTASYMSPEQAAGRTAEIGAASDIYSLGAILYHLLTGRPPHVGESTFDVLVQVMEREPELPRKLNSQVPSALEQVCLKCLEKSPENRYPSATALAQDLERYLRDEPVEARAAGWWDRLRRWSRREPALSTRLFALAGFVALEMFDYHILSQQFGKLQHYSLRGFHLPMLTLAGVWATGCVAFQQWLEHSRRPTIVRLAWSAGDILMLLIGLMIADGVASGLVAVFPLLIVASGLWSQLRVVWFTTIIAVTAYAGLAIDFHLRRVDLQSKYDLAFDRHLAFIVAMLLLGATTAHQVRRLKSLSRYFESRRRE
jgi:predicted Ser/Thr protein kinase